MERLNAEDLARRVVEEPKSSVLAYFIIAAIAGCVLWALLPSIPDPSTLFRKIASIEKLEPGPRPARGDVRAVFTADDYPIDALQNGEEGTAQAQLDIDSSGRVTDCAIIRSSGFKSLDDATCGIMKKRARFRPARDARGHAVPDTVVTPTVTWRLED